MPRNSTDQLACADGEGKAKHDRSCSRGTRKTEDGVTKLKQGSERLVLPSASISLPFVFNLLRESHSLGSIFPGYFCLCYILLNWRRLVNVHD